MRDARRSRLLAPTLALLMPTLLLLASFSSGGCASSESAAKGRGKALASGKTGVGKPLPSLVVKRLANDQELDLGSMKHRAALVDIWASWCAPCKEEMPLLDEMARRLKSKGIEIIAISIDEDRDSARSFLASRKSWALTLAHDPEGKVPETLRPGKMPTSYVVDGEGTIRFVNEGFDREDLAKLERQLLELAGSAS